MTEVEKAIEARMQEMETKRKEADLALALKPEMIEKEAETRLTQTYIDRLDTIIRKVNAIDPIVTTNGDRYTVNCYSVSTSIFGELLGRLLGLVNIAGAMFTSERQNLFEAITGISYLSWISTKDAFGSRAYFSKGDYVENTEVNFDELHIGLTSICVKLDLPTSTVDKLTQTNLDRYFANAKNKALQEKLAYDKAKTLINDEDEDSNYTIED